ncbi:OLC1v1033347C1 [Oldenlandia corymbosa var. corymbosa]|uniref:OLC1v1033347C1 n=1 Tax=Oldenlandia corymbosa var. corymbosa TaxID=529605 RepID=A0AAV1CNU7_OLDCO|nr:OLC1v1033347C1 [Oldenlandia corymbosa var. corymbosa]
MADNSFQVLMQTIPYITAVRDRNAAALVCKGAYRTESDTRDHAFVPFCYSTNSRRLSARFPNLRSLTLNGKPNTAAAEDSGGLGGLRDAVGGGIRTWMIVRDSDLYILAAVKGKILRVLKLDTCSGFSTNGLLQIARTCRKLTTLYLGKSKISDLGSEWLHEIAMHHTLLERLDFYLSSIIHFNVDDLERIARNCPLTSLKITDCRLDSLEGVFNNALSLEELRSLDLLYAYVVRDVLCQLLKSCPNLEVLQTVNEIGDEGLAVVGEYCRWLKRIRIERGYSPNLITQKGLILLAEGCHKLESVTLYVDDINNEALELIGCHLQNLVEFNLVLLDGDIASTDLPLDHGVKAFLISCQKTLTVLSLYLRPGSITDFGLANIGAYSLNIRKMALCDGIGNSDQGLKDLCKGCPSLQELVLRNCIFSD